MPTVRPVSSLNLAGDFFFELLTTEPFFDLDRMMTIGDNRNIGDFVRMIIAAQITELVCNFPCKVFRDFVEFFHSDLIRKIIPPWRKLSYINLNGHITGE